MTALLNEISLSSSTSNSLECYVCKDQEDNKDKCVETVKTCDLIEERCMSIVKWGSTRYWSASGTKQFYISKSCASKQYCDNLKANYTRLCDRISYNDWTCVDCCHGDRCNFFITLGSSSIIPNQLLIFISFCTFLLVNRHKSS